jgi:glutamate N-acetyltransferase/amino-acid N-acetyltransferase
VEVGIRLAANGLSREPGGDEFASSIMTTDTRPKSAATAVEIDGQWVRIGGAAKGSGMIAPNMATMLAFLTTDASVEPQALSAALHEAVDRSFNCLTVDGDTSTNDMAVIMANGASGRKLGPGSPGWTEFGDALLGVCVSLAKQIARDGEGATKLVEVRVNGAVDLEQARAAAKTIAESPLVKTALFGSDPNWGRIVAAAGRSGAEFDPMNLSVDLAGLRVFEKARPTGFDEANAAARLRADTVVIAVDLGAGDAAAVVWTCDYSMDYIRINADYRT